MEPPKFNVHTLSRCEIDLLDIVGSGSRGGLRNLLKSGGRSRNRTNDTRIFRVSSPNNPLVIQAPIAPKIGCDTGATSANTLF